MSECSIEICPLCESQARLFYKDAFYLCRNCRGIFRPKSAYPDPESERHRYLTHNNDVNDTRYRQFVRPVTLAVTNRFSATHQGLDYGAGTGPVVSVMLQEKGYQIAQYDPFFSNNQHLLGRKYDYIVACEVIEHFHHPYKEFKLLKSLLAKKGGLFCMTNLYHPGIDFGSWYYKNDLTHVFIYQKYTLVWIKDNIGFSQVKINNRLIVFENPAG